MCPSAGCVVGATNVEQQMKEIMEHRKDWKARKWPASLGAPSSRAEGDQTVFRVHKGVKTFAFSKKSNLIVTGGMDRIIRMWNPYMPGYGIISLLQHFFAGCVMIRQALCPFHSLYKCIIERTGRC